jgi:two-component system, response regulator PdtaR
MITAIQTLIVENAPLLRMDIVKDLSDQDLHVFQAGDADQPISIPEQYLDIRLIITGDKLALLNDGLKLAEAVQRWPPVKIIVVSGHRVVEITDLPDGSIFFAKPSSVIDARSVA